MSTLAFSVSCCAQASLTRVHRRKGATVQPAAAAHSGASRSHGIGGSSSNSNWRSSRREGAAAAAAAAASSAATSTTAAQGEREVRPGVWEGYWTWEGHRIRYQRSGSNDPAAPAVLCVHG